MPAHDLQKGDLHGSTARKDDVRPPEEPLPTGYVRTDFSPAYLYEDDMLVSLLGHGGFAKVTM